MKSILKNKLYKNPGIEIRRSPIHGWGVFSRKNLKKNSIIEESPFIIIPTKDLLNESDFNRYTYGFSDYKEDGVEFGFGFAGLYNHSSSPNVECVRDKTNMIMIHYCIRDVFVDEELFIDYGDVDPMFL